MEQLEARGFRTELDRLVLSQRTPVLGICLGMQLMFDRSEEGVRPGLGWMPGDVKRFRFDTLSLPARIPHMGWNEVRPRNKHPLFAQVDEELRYYFIHSYHVMPRNVDAVAATAEYGYEFCCAVARGGIMGVQFHPEKSHRFGLDLLRRFATL